MKLPPVAEADPRVIEISEAALFFLAPTLLAEVIHWNSPKDVEMTLHIDPSMDTAPNAHPSMVEGNPVPVTVMVVPPPMLPSEGELEKIDIATSWVS